MELFKYVRIEDFEDFGVFKQYLKIKPIDPAKDSFDLSTLKDPTTWSDLGGVKLIGGDLIIDEGTVTDLNGLEYVGGELVLYNTRDLTSLGNTLKRVEGDIVLRYSKVEDLGSLEYVGGHLYADNKNTKSLGNLKEVGGYVDLSGAVSLKTLGNLTTIGLGPIAGSTLWLLNTPNLKSLGNLETVAGGKIHVTQSSSTAKLVKDSKLSHMIVYHEPITKL